jgi:hypothetical protein
MVSDKFLLFTHYNKCQLTYYCEIENVRFNKYYRKYHRMFQRIFVQNGRKFSGLLKSIAMRKKYLYFHCKDFITNWPVLK